MVFDLFPFSSSLPLTTSSSSLRAEIVTNPSDIDAAAWDALLDTQAHPTPFMRHAYLAALHTSGSAAPANGWEPHFVLVWDGDALAAACPLYLKAHSYGEYVFDWAWARAYEEHDLAYYPKALIAVPFTPVPGTRLMARDAATRTALLRAVLGWCKEQELSSLHLLFGSEDDLQACSDAGLMQRTTVQFHWKNTAPTEPAGRYENYETFLTSLTQEKRKKIRQEQRRVAEAGVQFRWARGADITAQDWAFFYRCYERTYLEHGNAPYLSPAFFERMASEMPEAWLMFTAERNGHPFATSLIAVSALSSSARGQKGSNFSNTATAFGRYWGALERVDNLHFDACYYQPIRWCIEHGYDVFEGGAQGEHKMARALMPQATHSAHWLAHPAFADAVERFLEREGEAMTGYLAQLQSRTPFRSDSSHTPIP